MIWNLDIIGIYIYVPHNKHLFFFKGSAGLFALWKISRGLPKQQDVLSWVSKNSHCVTVAKRTLKKKLYIPLEIEGAPASPIFPPKKYTFESDDVQKCLEIKRWYKWETHGFFERISLLL